MGEGFRRPGGSVAIETITAASRFTAEAPEPGAEHPCWRARQLARLGIPLALAEAVADHVDWHQIAALVCRGCPPRLALQIVM